MKARINYEKGGKFVNKLRTVKKLNNLTQKKEH